MAIHALRSGRATVLDEYLGSICSTVRGLGITTQRVKRCEGNGSRPFSRPELNLSMAFDEQRLGNDGTEASRPCKLDNGDNQMKEKDDEIAHPGMVSKPEKTPDFSRIQ